MSGQKKTPQKGLVAGERKPHSITARFAGTTSAREIRVLVALVKQAHMREALDRAVGASNSPDAVLRLRCKGLEIPCERLKAVDRDGKICRPGRYSLTRQDRRAVVAWMRREGMV